MQEPTPIGLSDRLFNYLDRKKPSDRWLLYILSLVVISSGVYALHLFNQSFVKDIPAEGGTLMEGVIGTPRFVNPVLAVTKADHDLVALMYSGLLKISPEGELQNDLADSINVSDDGLVYNIVLKQNRQFHDGLPIRAEDVAYTIALIQDPVLKSPLRGSWNGVTVEVISDYELNLVLEEPYAPFMENLTVGIIPKHVWGNLSDDELPFSQYNTEPVGSGAYKLDAVTRNKSGLVNEYRLEAHEQGEYTPNIASIVLKFFQNESELTLALENGSINATAALGELSLARLDLSGFQVIEKPLPRVFSIFFNQNKSPVLRDSYAREALELMIDREELVDRALGSYGTPSHSPIPPGFTDNGGAEATSTPTLDERLAKAKAVLEDGDWEQAEDGHWEKILEKSTTTLAISLRSANTSVFEQTAAYLTEVWNALGVKVEAELYEQGDLVQTVIRPRDYQALLFGVEVGRSLDLYPFWHSSQREDPGLNVSLYTNITADKLLSDLRKETDPQKRAELLEAFTTEIKNETPAIFLFSPSFVYLAAPEINLVSMDRLSRSSERFSNIRDWFIKKSSVWPVFAE